MRETNQCTVQSCTLNLFLNTAVNRLSYNRLLDETILYIEKI